VIPALLRSEFRKTRSTKLWWGLLVPVATLSLLINLFGGVFTLALGAGPEAEDRLPLLLASLAYSLALTATFAGVHGAVATAGEFRHRTITTTYLIAPGRGPVLAAKMLVAAGVGAVYALVSAALGIVGGLLGQESAQFPEPGALLAVVGIGAVVCALWAAFGAALGTALGNQVTVVVLLLVYVLLGEPLLSLLLTVDDSPAVAGISAYLPVNAGEVGLYDVPARVLVGNGAEEALGFAAGVSGPPPWWGGLLILTGWTAVTAAAATWLGRRDVT
jgi:ABC-type transport system involved in multi-copper enzyme maturation permease subunit